LKVRLPSDDVLAELLPIGARMAWSRMSMPKDGEVSTAEVNAISGASARRKREFLVGRVLARKLLTEFDVVDHDLLIGADRAPEWPTGLLGSITHSDRICGVVVAEPGPELQGIGLDVEPAEALEEDLWGLLCTRRERDWLAGLPAKERGLMARLMFSAKEAVYKCQYRVTRRFLEFEDVELDVDPESGSFTAKLLAPGMKGDVRPRGGWRVSEGFLVSLATVDGR
jgi:4'-phosphopantetheinyl transferase EntD